MKINQINENDDQILKPDRPNQIIISNPTAHWVTIRNIMTKYLGPPIHVLRKKCFKRWKFLVITISFIILIILVKIFYYPLFCHFFPPPYPFEPNQQNVNSLLNEQEFKKVFEPYLGDVKCRNNSMTLVAINSATKNFDRRQAIRQTWGNWIKESNQTLLFFLLTPKDHSLLKELELENYYYNDLIISSINETYYLLTFKTLFMINWTKNQCSNVKYLIKCDDDMFVNWKKLNQYLIEHQNNTNVIIGSSHNNSSPNRNVYSRWYMPYDQYEEKIYPTYVDGPIYIITQDLLPKLIDAVPKVKPIYLEDVYVTGLLRNQIPESKIISKEEFIIYHIRRPINCFTEKFDTIHRLNFKEIRRMYEKFLTNQFSIPYYCVFFRYLC